MSRSTRPWFRLAVPALLVIASIVGGLGPVPGASGQVIATATPAATPAVTVSAVASVSPVATAPAMADVPGTSTPAAVVATTPVMAVASGTATTVVGVPTSVATVVATPDAVATGSVVAGTATVMVTGTSVAGTVTPVVSPVATAGAGVPPAGAAGPPGMPGMPGMPGNPWGGMVPGMTGRGSVAGGVAPTPKPVTAVTGSVRSRDTMSGPFTSLVAGYAHTCGITAGGTAYCWGGNSNGQLGDGTSGNGSSGTSADHALPVAVSGGLAFTSLVAGDIHTCGLTSGGTAYCWGANRWGQIGDGTTEPPTTPVAVSGGRTFTSLVAGGYHTCGLTSGGTAYCWGANGDGRLGDGTAINRTAPSAVSGLTAVSSVSAGTSHSCAVTVSGALSCWGSNSSGQLGDSSLMSRSTAATVSGQQSWSTVSAGGAHSCAVTTSGVAYCWGSNIDGQVGDGTSGSTRTVPFTVYDTGTTKWAMVSTGGRHTCGVTQTGSGYCWGYNGTGQLGDGSSTSLTVPTLIPGFQWSSISAGDSHTCGITIAGIAYCWGANGMGQLGDGTSGNGNWNNQSANRSVPTAVDVSAITSSRLPVLIASVSPGSTWAGGGTTVTITGSNFAAGAAVSVGSRPATEVTVVSSTQLTARAPASNRFGDTNSSGTTTAADSLCLLRRVSKLSSTAGCPESALTTEYDVAVTNPDGGTATLPRAVMYRLDDANNSGTVTATDALCVLRRTVGLPATIACPAPVGDLLPGNDPAPIADTWAGQGPTLDVRPTSDVTRVGDTVTFGLTLSTTGAGTNIGSVDLRFRAPAGVLGFTCEPASGWLSNVTTTASGTFCALGIASTSAIPAGQLATLSFNVASPTFLVPIVDFTATDTSGATYTSVILTSGVTVGPLTTPTPVPSASPTPLATATASPSPSTGKPFTSLVAGERHTCGLVSGGIAYCWGQNWNGKLGDATTDQRTTPVAVNGGLTFTSLVVGVDHTCGLDLRGTAYCWGQNGNGQLGDVNAGIRTTPVAVSGGLTYVWIVAGSAHTCGLTAGGTAYCWGNNDRGQLGDGTSGTWDGNILYGKTAPVAVSGGLTFTSLVAGAAHTCGLTSGGTAYCWGQNWDGRLGDGTTDQRTTPVVVSGGLTFTSLVAGGNHTCGLASGGTAYCWGSNDYGQLGDVTIDNRTTPLAVSGRIAFNSLVAGYAHTCGRTSGGTSYCWGRNNEGQLGDGTVEEREAPVEVTGRRTFTSLAAGGSHTCGLTTSGDPYCWGANWQGQLGDGTTESPRTNPTAVDVSAIPMPTPVPTATASPTATATASPTPVVTPAIHSIRIANVRDTSFAVSWVTGVASTGTIRWGQDDGSSPTNIAADKRGASGTFTVHFATVSGLAPSTGYRFDVVSGSTTDTNGGAHYLVTTGPTLGATAPDQAFGTVSLRDGSVPASVVVHLTASGPSGTSAPLAALVTSAEQTYWAVNLGNLRTASLDAAFPVTADTILTVTADGGPDGTAASTSTVAVVRAGTLALYLSDEVSEPLQAGWNLIALRATPATSMTASMVCTALNVVTAGTAVELDRWINGGWDGHRCGLPVNDFTLEPGPGYFVRLTRPVTWTYRGAVVATPATLSLGAGWNLVGASAISGTPSVASTTCSQLNTVQAGTAVELDRWIDGGWEGHRCGLPVNDFTLQSGQGYFIRLTRPATWAPVGAAPVSASSIRNTTEASTPVAPSLGVVRP